MKLLFDQNISFRIIPYLPECFVGSQQVRNVGLLNKSDFDVWEFARCNNYIIVTFDADFYDISMIKETPPKIIWLRTGNLTTSEIAEILTKHSEMILEFIAEDDRLCMEIY